MTLSLHQIIARSENTSVYQCMVTTTEVPNNARTDNILYNNKYKFSVTKP